MQQMGEMLAMTVPELRQFAREIGEIVRRENRTGGME
jgi:hypothetical protein